MHRQPARVLRPEDVCLLLEHVEGQRYSARNRVIILLSFKAGLRACEISGLEWPMVLASDHRVSDGLTITRSIAKLGSGRRIPVHKQLKRALSDLHKQVGRPKSGFIICSQRGGKMSPDSVVNWFTALYRDLGLNGCSSHSGRRTFITHSARLLAKTGGSLRDVQELAGHRALTTTERYIAGDREAQRRLIALI
ncbi:tyrosine-type recombinase/integrase [Altericroceibacterium endophyticum]|uniref:Tyrosine-type recombinase/integrase n=1 Tax=Altericroceibacterium endophyticum TaxID=1808508 RepID=A0A6I4T9M6_9SPHN|nr:site-specific integrase [Altericroceibacterium endophyticum]MXO66713.1 tyrosine-type recombinase/integrase [Altericroceibacterium endophyticum]